MRILLSLFTILFCYGVTGCAVTKHKDVTYLNTTQTAPKLNVFSSKKGKKMPVLIFVHGGNWNSGSKDQYGFFGRNFARKGIVTVIPDYTLSPLADYDAMTAQIAAVIQWTKQNVAQYNGDPDQIFIKGHSAGGHLAALAVMNPKYGINSADIKGIILNDAAGLDMKHYLEEYPPTTQNDYLATWSSSPEVWQDASPIYFLNAKTPPFLIYIGDKTYKSIKEANMHFIKALHPFQPDVTPIHINKKHVPMIVQYIWPWSKRYDEVIDFIAKHKK